MAPQDPLLGSVLDGRYRLVHLLGRGGMGNVYLAEETRLKRRCAVKVLHPHLTHERANVERFLREAQTIAQFEHPNIVEIFAYGEEPNGVVFFAMELLSGEDLDTRVKAGADRPYSMHEVCGWAIQAARAVAVVHDAGLIHRDIKVSNIFLARRRDGEEVVKLLDFGIARPEDGSELTATGVALGTPSYMSPEQIENRAFDRRADVYSFGVLLYKLATGHLPFTGDAIQVAVKHRDVQPPSPSLVAPDAGIWPELENIILTAMAKQPARRFQTMQAVEAALVAVVEAEAPDQLAGIVRTRPTPISSMPPTRHVTGSHSHVTPIQAGAQVAEPTPSPVASTTGPTSAMPALVVSGSTRNLYLLTAGSVLGAILLLTLALMRGGVKQRVPLELPAPTVASTPPAEPGSKLITPPPDTSLPTPKPEPPLAPKPEPPPAPKTEPPPSDPPKPETTPPTVKSKSPLSNEPLPGGKKRPDPLAQVMEKAIKCRRKHRAVHGPKIAVTYWIGVDGTVHDSTPVVSDDLGKCLAQAVARVQFEPKLVLDRRIEL